MQNVVRDTAWHPGKPMDFHRRARRIRRPRGLRWAAVALTVVLSGVVVSGTPLAAEEEATATVTVGTTSVGVGQTTSVAVQVRDVEELYAVDLQLSFDPDVVEVMDADPAKAGVQLRAGDFLDRGLEVRNTADNDAGTIWYAATQLNPSVAKSGSGPLLHIAFAGLVADAVSPIRITEITMASRTGDVILPTVVDGEIRVVSPAEAPATATSFTAEPPVVELPTQDARQATSERSGEASQPTSASKRESDAPSAPATVSAVDRGTARTPSRTSVPASGTGLASEGASASATAHSGSVTDGGSASGADAPGGSAGSATDVPSAGGTDTSEEQGEQGVATWTVVPGAPDGSQGPAGGGDGDAQPGGGSGLAGRGLPTWLLVAIGALALAGGVFLLSKRRLTQ